MCGIIGYVGPQSAVDVMLAGLQRLEYRGYDSAGVAIVTDDGDLETRKRAGKLQVLRDDIREHPLPVAHCGVGHTRWATHGAPNDENAHPHLGDEGRLALIHNGIIENFAELKAELAAKGIEFVSETDSEVAAKLVGEAYRDTGSLERALRDVVNRLEGAFTLLAVHQDEPGLVVGARRNSPLVIGVGEGENFLGSDVAAFVEHTRHALEIGQDEMVAIRADRIEVTTFAGEPVEPKAFEVAWDASAAEKGGFTSFMAKEIDEEPEALANTLRGRIRDGLVDLPDLGDLDAETLRAINRVVIVGCGTAAYSGMVGRYAMEAWSRVPTTVELAHEFRYSDPILDENTLVVSISQSGETMDTLMAVRHAKDAGARVLSICNTQGATIPRESDAAIYTHCGPEVAVASSKAVQGQVAALYLLGLAIAEARGSLNHERIRELTDALSSMPDKVREVVHQHRDEVRDMANGMSDTRSVLFLGRHSGYPVALEGALKLKELAYIHAEGFAAGELKHGPIALIEPGQKVFVIVPSPRHEGSLHPKIISNIQEIRARGARVIAIAEQGDAAVLPYADEVLQVPLSEPFFDPFLTVVPLQIFAMELATAKGLDVDQPRNLAKSVTVE